MVTDQVGCPTSAVGLVRVCCAVIERRATGIQHWSDAAVAIWFDLAVAIGELAVAAGMMACALPVEPISTADYPTSACRPPYSLFDSSATRAQLGLRPKNWRCALRGMIADVGA